MGRNDAEVTMLETIAVVGRRGKASKARVHKNLKGVQQNRKRKKATKSQHESTAKETTQERDSSTRRRSCTEKRQNTDEMATPSDWQYRLDRNLRIALIDERTMVEKLVEFHDLILRRSPGMRAANATRRSTHSTKRT